MKEIVSKIVATEQQIEQLLSELNTALLNEKLCIDVISTYKLTQSDIVTTFECKVKIGTAFNH